MYMYIYMYIYIYMYVFVYTYVCIDIYTWGGMRGTSIALSSKAASRDTQQHSLAQCP